MALKRGFTYDIWKAKVNSKAYTVFYRFGTPQPGFNWYLSLTDSDSFSKTLVRLTEREARGVERAARDRAIKLAKRLLSSKDPIEDLRMEERNVRCPYCRELCEWVDNAEIYGRRMGKSWMAYLCRPCEAWVGCHENTRKPLGTPANKQLRRMRAQVHEKLDFLWREGQMDRGQFYKSLGRLCIGEPGAEVHIGQADEGMCQLLLQLDPEEVAKWA